MNRQVGILFALLLGCGALPSLGQEGQVDSAILDVELDEFRKGLFTRFNEGKYEEMLHEFCHEDVIALWQDGVKSQGYDEVLAEFERLSEIIERIQVNPTVEERLVLNGGKLVISSGEVRDTYDLKRGETVELNSVWSATLVKEDDKWRLLSFSGSANAFDNDVIRLYFGVATNRIAGIAALLGFLVGAILTFIVLRKRMRVRSSEVS